MGNSNPETETRGQAGQRRARPKYLIPSIVMGFIVLSIAFAAIVTVWHDRSSPETARPFAPAPVLGLTVHEAPLPLPEVGFTNADGQALTLADFRGGAVLVNLWATWCAPCIREMPSLDRAQAALGPEVLTILTLSQDREGMEVVGPFWEKTGLKYLTPYFDPDGAFARAVGAVGLPTTLLVDARGLEIARLQGPAEWDEPEMLDFLRNAASGQE